MTAKLREGVELQRRYYTETASRYGQMHAHEGAADAFANKVFRSILTMVGARSVLDVGTANGKTLHEMRESFPELFVCGIEPVAALVQEALRGNFAVPGCIIRATGETLPFADASFDVVCEFAVLHHVPNPQEVVREMLRVAKKAVFISDSNRFGQGSIAARLLKFSLYKAGLWNTFNYLRTRGKGYRFTEGDGVAYSYSVYDSFQEVANWADRVFLIPNSSEKHKSWFHPLFTSGGVIICGLRGTIEE